MSLAILDAIILASVLKFRRQEGTSPLLPSLPFPSHHLNASHTYTKLGSSSELHALSGETSPQIDSSAVNNSNKFARVMGLREVHILSVWAFLYVGVEVTTGGKSSYHILRPNPTVYKRRL